MAASYQIWTPATTGPATTSADNSINLGTEFYVTNSTCSATAIRIWRPPDANMTGTVLGRIWQVVTATTGTAVSGTDVTFTLSGTGWLQANLSAPVALTQNQRYRVGVLFPNGYAATTNYWNVGPGASGFTNGPLVAPSAANATGQLQGSFDYSNGYAYPANSFNGGNYWVDVVVSDSSASSGNGNRTSFMAFFNT